MNDDEYFDRSYGADCPDCEEPMEAREVPVVISSRRILGFEFQLWRWHTEYICLNCPDERGRQREEAIYDAGAQRGYDEARREFEARR